MHPPATSSNAEFGAFETGLPVGKDDETHFYHTLLGVSHKISMFGVLLDRMQYTGLSYLPGPVLVWRPTPLRVTPLTQITLKIVW